MTIYRDHYTSSHALVIGIDAYVHAGPLANAVNDANSVASLLERDLEFDPANITLLTDAAATRDTILAAMAGLIDTPLDPNARLVVFFAGHATTLHGPHAEKGYLVPHDGGLHKVGSLVPWDWISSYADLITAKHILFIMDACYSGIMAHRALPGGPRRFLSDVLTRPARQIITAGKFDQPVTDSGGGKNSLFTAELLDGVRRSAPRHDGVLTASSLLAHVVAKVGQAPASRQTPHGGHLSGDGDFVLVDEQDRHRPASPRR